MRESGNTELIKCKKLHKVEMFPAFDFLFEMIYTSFVKNRWRHDWQFPLENYSIVCFSDGENQFMNEQNFSIEDNLNMFDFLHTFCSIDIAFNSSTLILLHILHLQILPKYDLLYNTTKYFVWYIKW